MSPATKITVIERAIAGQTLHVVTDEQQAEAIRGITGTAALTKQQLGSLETLGFKLTVKKAKRKARKGKGKAKKKQGGEKVETRTNVIDDHLTQHVVVVRQFTRTFPTSNVWVLHDGNEAALIDSGFGDDGSVNARLKYLQKDLSGLDFGHIAIKIGRAHV